MKLSIKSLDNRSVDEVNKGISNIALILNNIKVYIFVDREIKEVKGFIMVGSKLLQKIVLGVFIGDVFDHDGGPPI